jgi:hypothetical protein
VSRECEAEGPPTRARVGIDVAVTVTVNATVADTVVTVSTQRRE